MVGIKRLLFNEEFWPGNRPTGEMGAEDVEQGSVIRVCVVKVE